MDAAIFARPERSAIGQATVLPRTSDPPTFAGVTTPLESASDIPTRPRIVLIAILGVVVIGGITDLILDRHESVFTIHVAFEGAVVLASLACTIWLWRGWRRTALSLEERSAERDAWRRNAEAALAGLGVAVERQFGLWHLTPAESEVALGLLKGLGHKEIAAASARSERTIRQHAVSVYAKAGVGGRAELAAFFLRDLSLPSSGGTG